MRTKFYLALLIPLTLSACALRPPEIEMLRDAESRLDRERQEIGPYTLDMKAEGSKMILSGRVSSEEGREKIEKVVSSAPGVSVVQNDLIVDSEMRASAKLSTTSATAEEVLSRFQRIKGDKPVKARVEMTGGVALLTGTVGSEEERSRFLEAARATSGVTTVVDNLRVPPPLSDDQLAQNVRAALAQENLLSAGDVAIDSKRGTVTVRGDRSSFREVDKLLSVVLMVDGVEDVRSQMTVKGNSYDRSIRVQ